MYTRACPVCFSFMRRGLAMLKKMSVLFFGIVYPLSAMADDSLVKFKGGIGVIPVSAGVAVAPTLAAAQTVESVNRDIVRGGQPPGERSGERRGGEECR